MSKGLEDLRLGLVRHHEPSWRYGLGAGLRQQSQVTYLGVWLHHDQRERTTTPLLSWDLEFLLEEESFDLPGVTRSDPFCILRVTGQSGALTYRANLIDRKT